MSQVHIGRAGRSMTPSESEVADALAALPDTYQVTISPQRFQFPESWENNRLNSYEPDFEVVNETGKRLIVEVKSVNALSLSNMVRFVEIAKAIRQTSGAAFLILVTGAERSSARLRQYPEFAKLHVRYASAPSEVVREIRAEFSELQNLEP